jgi:hypothetical protein
MPIEATLLKDAPYPEVRCPKCGHFPLEPAMRGVVQRFPWRLALTWPFFRRQPYCAIICSECMEIVGYESPPQLDIDTTPLSW